MTRSDLIVAPATPAGKGAVGIVRLSGPGTVQLAREILGRDLQPRLASLCSFRDGAGAIIDRGIALFFPHGHSYTGEDMLELQGHGGPVVQALLLRRCLDLGARMASPGEFTQRAFLNERLDLAQAEAVADLIDAQSEQAARGALRSLQGEFSEQIKRCVAGLIELRALVEVSMDFPEDGVDLVPDSVLESKRGTLSEELDGLLRQAQQGRRLREGATFVLVGSPNVGKSSLLNRLARDDVAIVSETPGTTRDVIREHIIIDGLAFQVLDTAGLRDSSDPLERLGMERTLRAIETADMVLHVIDHEPGVGSPEFVAKAVLRVVNKIDLSGDHPRISGSAEEVTVHVSAKTGVGIDLLRQAMLKAVGWIPSEESSIVARERHLRALQEAKEALGRSVSLVPSRELFAEEMRRAQLALSAITGEFTSDDLLGEIFSKFCIGK